MPPLFKAKTQCAYTLKILVELLQNNIRMACFEIDQEGIQLCMMDHQRTVLVSVKLQSENFIVYKFRSPKKLYIGVNLVHLHKMFKSIKRKDSIQLFIEDDQSTELGIKVIPKENNRVTTSFIKIQCIQTLDIDTPTGYGKPIIIPSAEYTKMIKDVSSIGNTIHIVAKNYCIQFKCEGDGIMKRHVEFGDAVDSDDESDDDVPEYKHSFSTEQLARIAKISGLGTNMHIYPQEELPLLVKSPVGTLGSIRIYLKSKEMIDAERLEQ